MALSTELLRRLNTEDEPLRKRIKLAKNAFYASNLPVVRKEALILDWLCKISPDDQDAWDALEYCLKQDQLDIKDQVKQSLIDIVVQQLTRKSAEENSECKALDLEVESGQNLMHYCKLLVSNPTMQQYFAREPKAFASLIESVLKSTYEFFKKTLNDTGNIDFSKGIDIGLINELGGTISSTYTILIKIVESVLQIYKISYSTKEELKSSFVESILYPLCKIVDHKCLDNTNRLGAAAHKCIQQLIFGTKNAQSKSHEANADAFQKLQEKLRENVVNTDIESNILVFISLFRAAIGVFKDDTAKLDTIFRSLVDSHEKHKKVIMSACLKCMQDITFDFDHKVNDVTLFAYCETNVDAMLLQEKTLTHSDLKLIAQLARFNPLVIEKRIPNILKKILLKKRSAKWSELMLAILDASVRLRKEEKLVSQILLALRSSLAEESAHSNMQQFFPNEFIKKFTKIANNITSSQTVVILRSLIYHLNTDCNQMLDSQDLAAEKDSIMKATIELLTAFFNGICVFEYKGALDWHEKFINALDELGSVLATSVDKAMQLNYNETIIELLLSAMESLSKVHAALQYYAPKIVAQKLSTFPISEDHWQQLVQRVANFGPDQSRTIMNRLIIRKAQALESTVSESSMKLSGLIGGIEHSWPSLLQNNTQTISCLKTTELTKLTSFLLDEMLLDKEKFDYWLNILKTDHVQECRIFIVLLLSNALIKIGNMMPESSIRNLTACVKVGHMTAAEFDGCDKIQKDIKKMTKLLEHQDSCKISKAVLKNIRSILNILSNLPLAFLTGDVRALTFLIIFAMCKECGSNNNVKTEEACHAVLSDLVDRPGIDVCRYLRPNLYVHQMSKHKYYQTAIELSLRSGMFETYMTDLQSCCSLLNDMCLLMDCIENVKPKLNSKKRQCIKNIEQKLVRDILPLLKNKVKTITDLKATLAVVKYSLSTEEIHTGIQSTTEYAIRNVFVKKTSMWSAPAIEVAAQIAVVALRNRNRFTIEEDSVTGLWRSILDHPNTNLQQALIDSTEKKDFPKILQNLHIWLIECLSDDNHIRQENISIMWKAVLKTDMSSERSKIRLAAIGKVLEAIQSLNISEKAWLTVLKLLCDIVNAKHLHLSSSIVDASLQLGLRSVDEVKLAVCDDALTLCSILIGNKPSLIIDRLPILLQLYKRIIIAVTMASKTLIDMPTEYELRCLAVNIEKVTGTLIKMKKDLLRLAPYLIADLLDLFADATIAVYVKGSLQNCISQWISVCDQHGIALLSRTLPPAMQEIFKTQVDTFNKFYKFSGKI